MKFPSPKLGKFRKVYFKIRNVSEQSETADNCKYCDCLTILVQCLASINPLPHE